MRLRRTSFSIVCIQLAAFHNGRSPSISYIFRCVPADSRCWYAFMQAAEQNRIRQYRCTPSLSFPRQWSQQSELEESPLTFSAALKRPRRRTIVVIGACRRIVELLGSILSPEKTAKAAAAAPNTVDQGLPSACTARRVQKLRNQRKTRCNRIDWSSFSKQSLDQLSSGRRGSAYWSTIFQVHNVSISC